MLLVGGLARQRRCSAASGPSTIRAPSSRPGPRAAAAAHEGQPAELDARRGLAVALRRQLGDLLLGAGGQVVGVDVAAGGGRGALAARVDREQPRARGDANRVEPICGRGGAPKSAMAGVVTLRRAPARSGASDPPRPARPTPGSRRLAARLRCAGRRRDQAVGAAARRWPRAARRHQGGQRERARERRANVARAKVTRPGACRRRRSAAVSRRIGHLVGRTKRPTRDWLEVEAGQRAQEAVGDDHVDARLRVGVDEAARGARRSPGRSWPPRPRRATLTVPGGRRRAGARRRSRR